MLHHTLERADLLTQPERKVTTRGKHGRSSGMADLDGSRSARESRSGRVDFLSAHSYPCARSSSYGDDLSVRSPRSPKREMYRRDAPRSGPLSATRTRL